MSLFKTARPDARPAPDAPDMLDKAALLGAWRASGRREGLDLADARGRLCYYPVGRGEIAFLPGGAFLLTLVNGAGTFCREGRWRMDGNLLILRVGRDEGGFRMRVAGGVLTLAPDRGRLRCPEKLLHWPEFERIEGA